MKNTTRKNIAEAVQFGLTFIILFGYSLLAGHFGGSIISTIGFFAAIAGICAVDLLRRKILRNS